MPKEMAFFIFLLEQYAANKSISADVVLRTWDYAGITDTICDMYEMYHAEAIENAFDDIDRMLADGGTAAEGLYEQERRRSGAA